MQVSRKSIELRRSSALLALQVAVLAFAPTTARSESLSDYSMAPEEYVAVPTPEVSLTFVEGKWDVSHGAVLTDAEGGREGGPCMNLVRGEGEPQARCLVKVAADKFIPGVEYAVGCWVKTELLPSNPGGALVHTEYSTDKGIIFGGDYMRTAFATNGEWQWLEHRFKVPREARKVSFYADMDYRTLGSSQFEGFTVYPIETRIKRLRWKGELMRPLGGVIDELTDMEVRGTFDSSRPQDASTLLCGIRIKKNGSTLREVITEFKEDWASVRLGTLEPGSYEVEMLLLQPSTKKILAVSNAPMEILASVKRSDAPANACLFDKRGRAIVNGKPFLPMVIYGFHLDRVDIARMAASPFNVLMPYKILSNDLDSPIPSNESAGYTNAPEASEHTVRATLDELHKNNLKIIFNVYHPLFVKEDYRAFGVEGIEVVRKAIDLFKDHPALLGWYFVDEITNEGGPITVLSPGGETTTRLEDCVPFVRNLYKEIKNRDPWHPAHMTLSGGTMCSYDYSRFRGMVDTFGYDWYTFVGHENRSLGPMETWNAATTRFMGGKNGMPFWPVAQIFNPGVYQLDSFQSREEYQARHKDPSKTEMLAQSLMFAIGGAKAFWYYSYSDLARPNAWSSPDFEQRWKDVCEVGQTIKGLEPFILSDRDNFPVTINFLQGSGAAAGLKNDAGQSTVLISAGMISGPQKAEIRVPSGTPQLRSRFGLTRYDSQKKTYIFEGDGVCCDILDPVE